MAKIDLIIENIRDEYMINLLEEGEVSELETLKTKKFLNESLGRIREMLIEEGAMAGVQNHLKNNWGKYLAGAGVGSVGYGMNQAQMAPSDVMKSAEIAYNYGGVPEALGVTAANIAGTGAYGAAQAVKDAGAGLSNLSQQGYAAAKEALTPEELTVWEKMQQHLGNAYDTVADKVEDIVD